MNSSKVNEIISTLHELKEDSTINKNIRDRIEKVISFLESDKELGVDKAIHEIEDLMENNNLPSYTRTQIWNIVSLLESS